MSDEQIDKALQKASMDAWVKERTQKYILEADGKTPKAVPLMEWAEWFGTADRHVADDIVGEYRVSTVFLGLDSGWTLHGPPVLWETMIFHTTHKDVEGVPCAQIATTTDKVCHDGEWQERYTSHEDAIAGHQVAVAQALAWGKEKP